MKFGLQSYTLFINNRRKTAIFLLFYHFRRFRRCFLHAMKSGLTGTCKALYVYSYAFALRKLSYCTAKA